MQNTRTWRNSYNYKNKCTAHVRRRKAKPFNKCEKYICINLVTGEYTCGLLFMKSGKVKIGLDVWRLTNPADCCDYPVRAFPSLDIAMQYFRFETAPRSFYFKEPEERDQAP